MAGNIEAPVKNSSNDLTQHPVSNEQNHTSVVPGDKAGVDDKQQEWLKEMRTGLMVMASVILSVTYQAGTQLKDEGGTQMNSTNTARSQVNEQNEAVINAKHAARFNSYRKANTLAFTQSILIIVVLLSSTVLKRPAAIPVLQMWLVFCLMTLSFAYIFSNDCHTFTAMNLLFGQFLVAPIVFILGNFVMKFMDTRGRPPHGFRWCLNKTLGGVLFFVGLVVSVTAIGMLYAERKRLDITFDPTGVAISAALALTLMVRHII